MKATGIVRRIDDLGRIVVPKEIRRTLRVREGDPMEIYTNHQGEIILKKYSPIGEIDSFAKQYAESLAQVSGYKIVISDRDQIIAVAGGAKKNLLGKDISQELEQLMSERDVLTTAGGVSKSIAVAEGEDAPKGGQVIYPIICEGDIIGSVVIIAKEDGQEVTITEQKLAGVAATFLGRQMEA
ncbi:MAG: stage V sporulation protein T [Eubacterium sp.]|nr:stage V sporulation protein T [Eubacterium sp.]